MRLKSYSVFRALFAVVFLMTLSDTANDSEWPHPENLPLFFLSGKRDMNIRVCRREMVAAAESRVHAHPAVDTIILECTNMPPFLKAIRQGTELPVFDGATLIKFAWARVVQTSYT
jgi:hypothetical protein